MCRVEKNVARWDHGLISVNPVISLEIQETTTDTPKPGYPVSVLRFELGSTRMHNRCQDHCEY
jgi:hypothetical protein